MADLVIVDYGAGNVKSVEFALNRLGVKPILSSDADVVGNYRTNCWIYFNRRYNP